MVSMMIPISETRDGLSFKVKVYPKSSKNEIVGAKGDALGVKITAAPTKGKANSSCIALLADEFSLSKSQIEIVRGRISRNKVIRIKGISREDLEAILSRYL
jgi:uncharacterized protein (TIGR00251 family)